MFFLLYKSQWLWFFDDFPKISDYFLKISEDFLKLFRRPDECSRTFSENFWRLPKTFEEDPKMFRWYTNEFKYNLRDKLKISYRFYQFVTTRYTTDFYIIKTLSLSTTHWQYNDTVIQIYTDHLNFTLHRFL